MLVQKSKNILDTATAFRKLTSNVCIIREPGTPGIKKNPHEEGLWCGEHNVLKEREATSGIRGGPWSRRCLSQILKGGLDKRCWEWVGEEYGIFTPFSKLSKTKSCEFTDKKGGKTKKKQRDKVTASNILLKFAIILPALFLYICL
jgi:hypothetical protein